MGRGLPSASMTRKKEWVWGFVGCRDSAVLLFQAFYAITGGQYQRLSSSETPITPITPIPGAMQSVKQPLSPDILTCPCISSMHVANVTGLAGVPVSAIFSTSRSGPRSEHWASNVVFGDQIKAATGRRRLCRSDSAENIMVSFSLRQFYSIWKTLSIDVVLGPHTNPPVNKGPHVTIKKGVPGTVIKAKDNIRKIFDSP